jgi:hypothetical protein
MNQREKAQFQRLRREVACQRRWLLAFAKAMHKHVRTDLAPDAALPEMTSLVERISKGSDI